MNWLVGRRAIAEALGVKPSTVGAWVRCRRSPIPVFQRPDGRLAVKASDVEGFYQGVKVRALPKDSYMESVTREAGRFA